MSGRVSINLSRLSNVGASLLATLDCREQARSYKTERWRIATVSFALLLWATSARAIEITLPEEKAQLVESPLPGYALATALCYTCHSVDYILYQPPASPPAYWKTQVVKMQKTFGAPIPDSAVEPIIDYLVKTYGAERGTAASSGVTPESPKH